MTRSSNLPLVVSWIAAIVAIPSVGHSLSAGQPPSENLALLPQMIQDAKQDYHVPSDEELADAKRAVAATLTPVTDTLDGIPSGKSVAHQLGLDMLRQQLGSDRPDPDQLMRVCDALRETRWEIAETDCKPLRQTTAEYASLLRRRTDQARDDFLRQLDKLANGIQQHSASPSADAVESIREAYTWLALEGQSADLLRAIRDEFSRPNKIVTVSRPFLEKMMVREVTASQPVNMFQQGTHIQGQMHGKGTIGLNLPPDDDAVHMSLHFRAHVDSPLTARRRQVSIGAFGKSDITGRQSYFVTPDGLDERVPETHLSHNTQVCSVQVCMGCNLLRAAVTPLARRVAERQIAARDPQLRQQAGALLQARLTAESHAIVDQVNALLLKLLWDPMYDRDIEADTRLRNTATDVEAVTRFTTPWQLGAPSDPPTVPGDGMVLRFLMHESAFNNANVALAGTRLTDTTFAEMFYQGLKLQPLDSDAPDGPRIPTAITLADEDPIRIRFEQGRVAFRLRIKAFQDEENELSDTAWTVSTAYRPEFESGRLTVRRDEDVTIEPRDAPHVDALRAVLARFLVTGVVGQSKIDATDYRDGPQVRLGHFSLDDGWIGLGMVHVSDDKE